MKRVSIGWSVLFSVCLMVTWGCDDGDEDPPGGLTAFEIEVTCEDTVASIYQDPGVLPTELGAILRCAQDTPLSQAELQSMADANGYAGTAFTSGAQVYRVLYRTERGGGLAGYSSAIVYVPDVPRAENLPVLVASHGSRGQAAACAPSLRDRTLGVQADFERQVFPLLGSGFAVIAPDLAGYANYGAVNNPPSAYAMAEDVAKSTLDGVAAMRRLFGSRLTEDVIITGHSQGGHTALSALAYADSYGLDGTLAGVSVYAPLWLSLRTWGALFFASDQYPIATSPTPVAVSVWYHYTHGELLDGQGHGVDLFATGAQAGIRDFVDNDCWGDSYPKLEALGTEVRDLFDPDYIQSIELPATLGTSCGDNPLCTTWIDRMLNDRPHITGNAAAVPIQLVYGMQDTTIDSGRMACVIQRLEQDAANYSACVFPQEDHSSVLDVGSDKVVQWIAHLTLGEAEPTPCAADESTFVDAAGELLIECATPPPND